MFLIFPNAVTSGETSDEQGKVSRGRSFVRPEGTCLGWAGMARALRVWLIKNHPLLTMTARAHRFFNGLADALPSLLLVKLRNFPAVLLLFSIPISSSSISSPWDTGKNGIVVSRGRPYG